MTPGTRSTFTGAVFIAASLDGFLAAPDGDLTWLTEPAQQAGDTGYERFFESVDSIAMGRNTYETALGFGEWPYGDLPVFVLSRNLDRAAHPKVSVHRSVGELTSALAEAGVRKVYVDGGMLINAFLERGLIHELTLTTAPVILGRGLPLFHELPQRVHLDLREVSALGAGFTQVRYTVRSEASAERSSAA